MSVAAMLQGPRHHFVVALGRRQHQAVSIQLITTQRHAHANERTSRVHPPQLRRVIVAAASAATHGHQKRRHKSSTTNSADLHGPDGRCSRAFCPG
jgi:hypothetical protein